jgi:hypothetical protein
VDRPVVVTVVAVGVVEVSVHQVVDMVAMGNGGMTAARPVHMVGGVGTTGMTGYTVSRVFAANIECVLVDVVPVGMVQVTIVQVVNVAIVLDGDVPTVGTVGVIVVCVHCAVIHGHDQRPRKEDSGRGRP